MSLKKLKFVVVFIKLITKLVLQRSFGNIIYDLALHYEDIYTVKDFRRLEKVKTKLEKSRLDVTFLKNCQTFGITPSFLSFEYILLIFTEMTVMRIILDKRKCRFFLPNFLNFKAANNKKKDIKE